MVKNPPRKPSEGIAAAAKSLQSCPTLCDPKDGSLLGSVVPGGLQARTREWVAISFPNIHASKYIKQVLTYMKGKIDSNPKIVKNLDTSISTMNSSFSQKKSINSGLE